MMGVVFVLAHAILFLLKVMSSTVNSTCAPPTKCLAATACDSFDGGFVFPCNGQDEPIRFCCREKVKVANALSLDKTMPMSNPSRIGGTKKDIQRANKTAQLFSQECGESLGDRITEGEDSVIGEYPWMALLGYKAEGSDIPQFLCGGALINKRYVITAAHCLKLQSTNLTTVRLGELDIGKPIDCNSPEDCADPPKNYIVEKIIPHEDYQRTLLKNDIALLRLAEDVEYTDWIKPICLPFKIKISANYYDGKNLLIAGWGKTDSDHVGGSRILQKAKVRAWTHTACERRVPSYLQPLSRTQLCAGGTGQDVCKGDSGGPIMQVNTPISAQFMLVGVVSLGLEASCGQEEVPSVYTRVNLYLDWIVDNMEI